MPIVYVCNNSQCATHSQSDTAGSCDTCKKPLIYTWEDDEGPKGETNFEIKDPSGAVAYMMGHLATLVPTLEDKTIVHIKKLAASDANYRPQTVSGRTCDHDSERNGGNYQTIFYEVIVKGQKINVVGLGNHDGKGAKYKVVWDTGTKETVTL